MIQLRCNHCDQQMPPGSEVFHIGIDVCHMKWTPEWGATVTFEPLAFRLREDIHGCLACKKQILADLATRLLSLTSGM